MTNNFGYDVMLVIPPEHYKALCEYWEKEFGVPFLSESDGRLGLSLAYPPQPSPQLAYRDSEVWNKLHSDEGVGADE